MLSIKKNAEFKRIYGLSSPIVDKYIVMHYIPDESDELRYGISVSKKVGKAVTRNKIKRRIKAILRLNEAAVVKNTAVVFVARVRASEATYANLSKSVHFCLSRAHLLAEKSDWIY